MTNSQAITNFMYFAYNFTSREFEGMFKVTTAPQHLEEKFHSICKSRNLNGTQGIFAWFMELSQNNKDLVCEYITTTYSYKS